AAAPLDAVVGTLLNDLAAHADEVALVLADYHLVAAVEVHEAMLLLMEHRPPTAPGVVGTLAARPWPPGRMRARGDLVEVRAAALRFTDDETAAYLNGAMGVGLADADVAILEARTEGWAAALQLAALALHGRDDPTAFIAEFAGDDRF